MLAESILAALSVGTGAWLAKGRRKPTPKRLVRTHCPILDILHLDDRNVCEHVFLLGATGSGKTSIVKRMMTEMLRFDVGCVWLAVKPEEPLNAAKIAYKAGRRDVKLFKVGETKFNPVAYNFAKGFTAEDLADLVEQMDEQQSRSSGNKEDGFWKSTRKEVTIHAINLAHILHREKATFQHVYEILADVPSSMEEMQSEAWNDNRLRIALKSLEGREVKPHEARAIAAAHNCLTHKIPQSGGRVQGATTMHISSLLANFTRGELFDTTCSDYSNLTPDYALDGGMIIFADSTLKGKGYQFLQLAFLQQLTKARLKQRIRNNTPPCICVLDEYTELCAPLADAQACLLGRSQRLARISCAQSLSTLLAAMPEGLRAQHLAHTILGNHATKILCNATDPATMELFEKLTTKAPRPLIGGAQGADMRMMMNYHQAVMPHAFGGKLTTLKCGGYANGFEITAYLHRAGMIFENGLPIKRIAIPQDIS
jgi:type IV secretory pathway TraG/TraD family ATPase VirD4